MKKNEARNSLGIELNKTSKKWFPKGPKKFSNNLVNDIYSHLDNGSLDEIYGILSETCYFHNVLWPYFEEDVSNNHIELILHLSLYDKRNGVMDEILSCEHKFEILIKRMIEQTRVVDKLSNLRLHSLTWNFFGSLINNYQGNRAVRQLVFPLFGIMALRSVPGIENLLETDKYLPVKKEQFQKIEFEDDHNARALINLKKSWIYTILTNYMKLTTPLNSQELMNTLGSTFLHYSESLLNFLLILVMNKVTGIYISTMIRYIGFCGLSFGSDCMFSGSRQLLNFISLYSFTSFRSESKNYEERFVMLQKTLNTHFKKSDRQSLTKTSSVGAVNTVEIEQILKAMSLESLNELLHRLDIMPHVEFDRNTRELAIELILRWCYSPFLMQGRSEELFKDFDKNFLHVWENNSDDLPSKSNLWIPTTHVEFSTEKEFVSLLVWNQYVKFRQLSKLHISTVLERIARSESNQKMQSKYFAKINQLTMIDGSLRCEVEANSLSTYDEGVRFLFLLEIIKPNKYSQQRSVRLYGANILHIIEVKEMKKEENSAIFILNGCQVDPNYAQRYTHFVLPSYDLGIVFAQFKQLARCREVSQLALPHITKLPLIDHIARPPEKGLLNVEITTVKKEVIDELTFCSNEENIPNKRQKNNNITKNECSYRVIKESNSDILKALPSSRTPSDISLTFNQAKCLLGCLAKGVTLVETVPSAGNSSLINAVLTTININEPGSRSLMILPKTSYLRAFKCEKNLRFGTIKYHPDMITEEIRFYSSSYRAALLDISKLANGLGLEDEIYGSSAAGALLLYHVHIKKLWEEYLTKVKKDKSYVQKFPFKGYSIPVFRNNYEDDLATCITIFSNIAEKVQFLERIEPLTRLENDSVKGAEFLVDSFCKVVISTLNQPSIDKILGSNYDNIIVVGDTDMTESMIPILKSPNLARLIIINDSFNHFNSDSLFSHLDGYVERKYHMNEVQGVRKEFYDVFKNKYKHISFKEARIGKHNPAFKDCWLNVLPDTENIFADASVEEAEYCAELYVLMRKLHYPADRIGIVTFSARQKILLREVINKRLSSKDIADYDKPMIELAIECPSRDYVIASLKGLSNSLRLLPFEISHLGVFLVGSTKGFSMPDMLPVGDLILNENEKFDSNYRRQSNMVMMKFKNVNELHNYVKDLIS